MSYRYYKGFKQQKTPSNSLKVIGSHTNQQAKYDFLFVFHCNYVSICSLSTLLIATHQKLEKSLKGDITHHHIAYMSL